MRNRKNEDSGLDSLRSILGKIVGDLGIDRGLKELTLKNLWPEIVGERFKDNSRVVSVINKGSYYSLLVSVSSSSISQELFLFKKDILRKLSSIAMPLGFNIKDIIFSAKYWHVAEIKEFSDKKEENVSHFFYKNPTDTELQKVKVSDEIIESVKKSIETQTFSSPELKDRMLHTIIKDIKTQMWRKNNGYPVCKKCGIPINHWNPEKELLCPSCQYIN